MRKQLGASRTLVLTYDDGPEPRTTLPLLDLLRQEDARASFFVLGKQAQRYPEIVRKTLAEGHEVGAHGYSHLNAWRSSPWSVISDIRAGFSAIETCAPGIASFRPPGGRVCLATTLALKERAARTCWWTLDSGDTRPIYPDPSEVADRVSAEGGGILLLHDFHSVSRGTDFVLDVTRSVIAMARRDGIQICRMRDVPQRKA